MSVQVECIFCGQPAGSAEHIVAKWMLRDLDLYKIKSRIGFGRQRPDGELDEIDAPQPLGSFTTDQVCGTCNKGWMSRLENYVKPLLSPLLVTPLPADDRKLFQGLFIHAAVITRWLLKTACTFGTKMSVHVPHHVCAELFQERLNPEISADLSFNKECGAYVGMSREWSVFDGRKVETMSIPGQSFRFVWQVRHLAMRVAYFPGCEKNMLKPRFPVRLYPRFGVLPDYFDGTATRRSYHYDALEQVEHETTYFIGGNPENPTRQITA